MSNDKELVDSDDPEIRDILAEFDRRVAVQKEEERKKRLERLEKHLAVKKAAEEFFMTLDRAKANALPPLNVLLRLHSRDHTGWPFYCKGCGDEPNQQDYYFDWPCRTVTIICGFLEIPIPENLHHYRPNLEESV
jgi:hypothetical protein